MTSFLAIVALGIGTYFSRAVFIVSIGRRRMPPNVQLALSYVAPAVLGALIVTLLARPDGEVAIGVPELSAFVAAGAVAFKTRNHVYTLIVGMGTFWSLGVFF